jgi:hypothetical protein
MSSGGNAAAVSLTGTVRVTNPRSAGVAQAQGFARRTAINQSGRVNELTGGTVRPADAVTGAEIGPYRKSRLGSRTAGTRAGWFGSRRRS